MKKGPSARPDDDEVRDAGDRASPSHPGGFGFGAKSAVRDGEDQDIGRNEANKLDNAGLDAGFGVGIPPARRAEKINLIAKS